MKSLILGIVAHVDAGKTTLTEAMLYRCGETDALGRVDKGSSLLDNDPQERERGITIFSKQARITSCDTEITIIDTPGHTDFSCECERAMSVQDCAILVISAQDGVTAHTRTLWQLLASRRIPTFIFVNKCDLSERNRRELCDEVRLGLSKSCVDFTNVTTPTFFEEAASADEHLMDEFFRTERLGTGSIAAAVRRRRIFPCFFGSALKLRGVDELLRGITTYMEPPSYPTDMFGARVYKIMRDKADRRVAFMKITGGSLKPKDSVEVRTKEGTVAEKVEEIRIYNADRSRPLKEAKAGTVCAVYGLEQVRAGMGLGFEADDTSALTPALGYRIILPEDASPYDTYAKLLAIGEEDPSLSLSFDRRTEEIRISLMGEIQLEVLRRLVRDRIGIEIGFDEGRILYRETVAETVRGAGHFEPLRHYAEVHLEISPLPEGSGIIADTDCDTDSLALNWQRLILSHIEERTHRGRLIGAPLTDVRITLIAGRAHKKHTEGGDFRQATYRAIRQALMRSEAVLLEPTFDFRIEVPATCLGRVLTDITSMHGSVSDTIYGEETATVVGSCPVATMRSYPSQLRALSRGFGRIYMTPGSYVPAHNADEVIAASGYDPELDERNPAGSIFCKGGSGYLVPWYEADELMHVRPDAVDDTTENDGDPIPLRARAVKYGGTAEEDKELMRIFEATYGAVKKRTVPERKVNAAPKEQRRRTTPPRKGDSYVLIDGYNVIHAWDDLRALAEGDLSMARDALVRAMCSYSAFTRSRSIVVFDAYRVKDGVGSVEHYGNTTVVYTKERQTADEYIECATYEIAPTNYVRVVTSDMHEQYIILGNGALRVTPAEFRTELESTTLLIGEAIEKAQKSR